MKCKMFTIVFSLLLISALLISCGSEPAPVNTADTTADTVNADADPVETEPVEMHAIEKDDYGGRDFVILYPYIQLYRNFLFAEEISGDVVSDAIYKRDQDINEYLNINIKPYQVPNWTDYYKPLLNAVQAGDAAFDLV